MGGGVYHRGCLATTDEVSDVGPPDKTGRVDLSDEGIHWELGSSLSYGEYLHL